MRNTLLLVASGLLVNATAWTALYWESAAEESSRTLLNVSYDPTRELWRELNKAFIPAHDAATGERLSIRQSHGGSGSQARAVLDGLQADVVTLALWSDTDALRKRRLLSDGWEERLPNRSLPYYSTIVFVVRQGNPRQVHDWPDLLRPGVQVITPNPKTSGNGKLSFLAAWGAIRERGGSDAEARDFVTGLYQQVPVLNNGARSSTTTFAQNGIGDVHLTWENEAYLEVRESRGSLEIVYPKSSIRAEPFVAVVDAVVERKGTRAAADAYLRFLYSVPAQEIIAQHYHRPVNPAVAAKYVDLLPEIHLFPVTAVAESWDDAQSRFFAQGAIFDQVVGNTRTDNAAAPSGRR